MRQFSTTPTILKAHLGALKRYAFQCSFRPGYGFKVMTTKRIFYSALMSAFFFGSTLYHARFSSFERIFAASASFITPLGYQTNLMVYGPGRYQFMNYVRLGFPLSLLVGARAMGRIPFVWAF